MKVTVDIRYQSGCWGGHHSGAVLEALISPGLMRGDLQLEIPGVGAYRLDAAEVEAAARAITLEAEREWAIA